MTAGEQFGKAEENVETVAVEVAPPDAATRYANGDERRVVAVVALGAEDGRVAPRPHRHAGAKRARYISPSSSGPDRLLHATAYSLPLQAREGESERGAARGHGHV